jgi:hypothetical protein
MYNFKYLDNLPSQSLSNLNLVVFQACVTALYGSNSLPISFPTTQSTRYITKRVWEGTLDTEYININTGSIVDSAVAKGAKCAIGFTGILWTNKYEFWKTLFYQRVTDGDTIEQAVQFANDNAGNYCSLPCSTVIAGNRYLKLKK